MTTRFHSPALMFVNGRGDYLLNLPTLRALSAWFEGRWTLVTKPGVKALFYDDLPVSRLVEIECASGPAGYGFDADALGARLAGCDLFLSLNPWWTPSLGRLLARLEGVPAIGYAPAFPLALPLDFGRHTVDLGFELVRCLVEGWQPETFAAAPRFAPRHEAFARGLRAALPAGARLVVVHGDTKADKTWVPARFAEVIAWLLARDPACFVFDLGLNPAAGALLAHEPRLIGGRELVLPAAFALVGLADLFVGVDSCFLHAADLYRVPGVGLFGPTRAHEFGFRFGPHCHVTGPTMAAIEAAEVIAAIERLALGPRRGLQPGL